MDGFWDDFTRMTGASARNFPFVLAGNKALEEDCVAERVVWQETVEGWCHRTGVGEMPFVEVSATGDHWRSYEAARRLFGLAATLVLQTRDKYGDFEQRESVRPPPDPWGGRRAPQPFKRQGSSFATSMENLSKDFSGSVKDMAGAVRGWADSFNKIKMITAFRRCRSR